MEKKEIYSKHVAFALRKQGFEIIETGINQYRPDLKIFIFEKTDELMKAFTEITAKMK